MKKEKKASYKDYIDKNITNNAQSYKISTPLHYAGIIAKAMEPFWFFLGKMESEYYQPKLDEITVTKPVYVCGLARSGTTITLELLHHSNVFSSFTYQYYPFISFPLIWNKIVGTRGDSQAVERAHLDRIKVTAKSPEAIEEMIWMHFFPGRITDPDISSVLTENNSNPAFESFYKNSIRKMLLLGKKERYLAKGNYNLARIPYILKLYPDARFILLIREPEAHVASLMKQHYLFCKVANPRVLRYMKQIGHYEFGPHRIPPNYNSCQDAREIVKAWSENKEVEGWAHLWNNTYGFLHNTLSSFTNLSKNILLIRYEDLCSEPLEYAKKITDFCDIPFSEEVRNFAQKISAPDYYEAGFTEEEKKKIREITERTRSLFY